MAKSRTIAFPKQEAQTTQPGPPKLLFTPAECALALGLNRSTAVISLLDLSSPAWRNYIRVMAQLSVKMTLIERAYELKQRTQPA